jgi:hypothetical protein
MTVHFPRGVIRAEAFRIGTGIPLAALLMPIGIPNYNRKTDRLQFGTLIGIGSE